jgi:CheY-like chemotaxis protein
MLGKIGLHGVVVPNGDEAVRMLASSHFDLVLMDCQMPVMDGFAATRLIRSGIAGEQNLQIPIIAMTANALSGDRERCLQAGMNDYLSKPIGLDELRYKVLHWLTMTAPLVAPAAIPASEIHHATFDATELEHNCGNDSELVCAVIDAALSEVPEQMERLQTLLDSGDIEALARQYHVLAGVFSQLSAKRIVEQLRHAEKEAKLERRPADGWFPSLQRDYAALLQAITLYREELADRS